MPNYVSSDYFCESKLNCLLLLLKDLSLENSLAAYISYPWIVLNKAVYQIKEQIIKFLQFVFLQTLRLLIPVPNMLYGHDEKEPFNIDIIVLSVFLSTIFCQLMACIFFLEVIDPRMKVLPFLPKQYDMKLTSLVNFYLLCCIVNSVFKANTTKSIRLCQDVSSKYTNIPHTLANTINVQANAIINVSTKESKQEESFFSTGDNITMDIVDKFNKDTTMSHVPSNNVFVFVSLLFCFINYFGWIHFASMVEPFEAYTLYEVQITIDFGANHNSFSLEFCCLKHKRKLKHCYGGMHDLTRNFHCEGTNCNGVYCAECNKLVCMCTVKDHLTCGHDVIYISKFPVVVADRFSAVTSFKIPRLKLYVSLHSYHLTSLSFVIVPYCLDSLCFSCKIDSGEKLSGVSVNSVGCINTNDFQFDNKDVDDKYFKNALSAYCDPKIQHCVKHLRQTILIAYIAIISFVILFLSFNFANAKSFTKDKRFLRSDIDESLKCGTPFRKIRSHLAPGDDGCNGATFLTSSSINYTYTEISTALSDGIENYKYLYSQTMRTESDLKKNLSYLLLSFFKNLLKEAANQLVHAIEGCSLICEAFYHRHLLLFEKVLSKLLKDDNVDYKNQDSRCSDQRLFSSTVYQETKAFKTNLNHHSNGDTITNEPVESELPIQESNIEGQPAEMLPVRVNSFTIVTCEEENVTLTRKCSELIVTSNNATLLQHTITGLDLAHTGDFVDDDLFRPLDKGNSSAPGNQQSVTKSMGHGLFMSQGNLQDDGRSVRANEYIGENQPEVQDSSAAINMNQPLQIKPEGYSVSASNTNSSNFKINQKRWKSEDGRVERDGLSPLPHNVEKDGKLLISSTPSMQQLMTTNVNVNTKSSQTVDRYFGAQIVKDLPKEMDQLPAVGPQRNTSYQTNFDKGNSSAPGNQQSFTKSMGHGLQGNLQNDGRSVRASEYIGENQPEVQDSSAAIRNMHQPLQIKPEGYSMSASNTNSNNFKINQKRGKMEDGRVERDGLSPLLHDVQKDGKLPMESGIDQATPISNTPSLHKIMIGNVISKSPRTTDDNYYGAQLVKGIPEETHTLPNVGPQRHTLYQTNFEHEVPSSHEEVRQKGRTTHEVGEQGYNPSKVTEINHPKYQPIYEKHQTKLPDVKPEPAAKSAANDTTKPKPLPKRSCIVFGDEQFPLVNNLVAHPHMDHYFVKERTEIRPSHFLAKLVLRHQYLNRFVQSYIAKICIL